MPMRFSSASSKSAALRQSSLCSGSVETDGMRSRAFRSSRNLGWFWRANATAEEDMNLSVQKSTVEYRPATPGEALTAASVSRHGGINLNRPGVDPSAKRLRLFKALPAQPRRHVHGPNPVMADDDQPLVNVEFFLCASWHFTHRYGNASFDVCGCELPWLAHVHELGAL